VTTVPARESTGQRRARRGATRGRGAARLRWAVAIALLGAVAAMLASYRVSLQPLGLHPREVQFSAAQAEVEVDTGSTELGVNRLNAQLESVGHVARVDALLLKTDVARQIAGRAAGVPGKQIVVSGPFNLLLNRANHAATGPAITDPTPVASNYRLVVDFDGRDPMITLYAQAPTTRAAVAIVESMRTLLGQWVAHQEKTFPLQPDFRAVIRPLGPATGGVVDLGARWQLIALIFGLTMVCGTSLMLAVERRRLNAGVDGHSLGRLGEGSRGGDDWPHTRRVLPWALVAFVVMIFLVPVDAMSLPVHLPLNSKPDRVLLVAIVLLWVATLATVSGAARPRLQLTKAHFAILLFVAICFVSVPLNGHFLAINQEVTPVLKKLLLLISFVVFFVMAASALRPREVPRLITLVIGLGVFVAIAAIVERTMKYNVFYSLWGKVVPLQLPLELDKLDGIGRLSVDGPTAEPLELATLLAIVLPFAIVDAVQARSLARRIVYLLAVAILLGGSVATGRKTGVLAPACGVLVLIAYRPRQMLRAIAVAALPLFVTVHLMAPGQIGSAFAELLPGQATAALTTKDRVARYDAVRPDVMSHVLIGSGFQSYDPVKNRILDNEFMGLMIGVGGIGLAAYLGIFIVLLAMGHTMIRGPDPRRAATALALQAAIVTTAVANALFDELSFTHVSYLFFFLAALVVALRTPVRSTAPARITPRVEEPALAWPDPPELAAVR
jgi:hypothetical protein